MSILFLLFLLVFEVVSALPVASLVSGVKIVTLVPDLPLPASGLLPLSTTADIPIVTLVPDLPLPESDLLSLPTTISESASVPYFTPTAAGGPILSSLLPAGTLPDLGIRPIPISTPITLTFIPLLPPTTSENILLPLPTSSIIPIISSVLDNIVPVPTSIITPIVSSIILPIPDLPIASSLIPSIPLTNDLTAPTLTLTSNQPTTTTAPQTILPPAIQTLTTHVTIIKTQIIPTTIISATTVRAISTITIPQVTTSIKLSTTTIISVSTETIKPTTTKTEKETVTATATATVTATETETATATITVPLKMGDIEFPKDGYKTAVTIHVNNPIETPTSMADGAMGLGSGASKGIPVYDDGGKEGEPIGFIASPEN